MVKSKNLGFEVKILQKCNEDKTARDITNATYEPLREVMSPMGIYIVAVPNQEFIIELKSQDYNIYGARLWIDEQEIYYKKTFKSRGFFMGFKLGEGRFQAFKFSPPTFENKASIGVPLTKSEIKIEFYRTTARLVPHQNILNKSIRRAQDEYIPGVVKENKKFFRKSLTVSAGDLLYKPGLDKHMLLKKLQDQKSKKFRENVINYSDVLDTITFYYGDFNSLLIQGVLSLANYDHLNVTPIEEVKKKPKIVERLMMTIIRKHDPKGGITVQQIEDEFKKLLRKSFDSLEVGPLLTFISLRHQLFQIDDKNQLKCSETAKNIYLDLRDVDPEAGIVPNNYFKTGVENNLQNKTLTNHNSNMPKTVVLDGKENGQSKPPIFIDLTEE